MRALLFLLVVLAGAACSKQGSDAETPAAPPAEATDSAGANADAPTAPEEEIGGDKSIEDMRAESLASVDRAACEAAGGEVRQEGMLGMYRCVKPYADAGKACDDKSDCEGQCRFEGEAPTDDSPVTGVCQRDDSPFGCYSEVEDGKIVHAICVD